MMNHDPTLKMNVLTPNGYFDIDGLIVDDVVYGFEGVEWRMLYAWEGIFDGQKMILCHIGDTKFRLCLFNRWGIEINGHDLLNDGKNFFLGSVPLIHVALLKKYIYWKLDF